MSDDQRTPVIEDVPVPGSREPRSSQGREVEVRPNGQWTPQANLPVPNPQDGWTFRWIRTGTQGNADNANVSMRFREGFVPVKAEEVPELHVMSDIGSRFEGQIEIGGLLLCKIPTEMVEQRRAHYAGIANQQLQSVDSSFMRENDPRMPVLNPERSSRTQFGKGS